MVAWVIQHRPSKRSHLIQKPPACKHNLSKHGSMGHSILGASKGSLSIQKPPISEQTCNKHGSMRHAMLHPSTKSHLIKNANSEQNLNNHGSMGHSMSSPPQQEEPINSKDFMYWADLQQACSIISSSIRHSIGGFNEMSHLIQMPRTGA